MGKTLIIIESPGKLKKMREILGNKYEIMASAGHILNFKKGGLKDAIDFENNFKPNYEIISDKNSNFKSKKQIVNELKKAAKNASDIILATDQDREGEMIAWSLAYVLKLKNPKRITFNAITKGEIIKSIKNPKTIDYNLVDAQKTRQILDIIVGYELSPILWKTIEGAVSAGRVQSVVVKLVVEKEKEITDFLNSDISSFFKYKGSFNNNIDAILYEIESNSNEIKSNNLMNKLVKSKYKVKDIMGKESVRNPSPPFITSSLQQEASSKLKFSVKKTMSSAQKLYEGGYITYMRTDSTALSKEAMSNIKKYIIEKFTNKYYKAREYKSKSKNSQEAHEAIRPTDVFLEKIDNDSKIGNDEKRLYNLIWKRTIASQMESAIFNVINSYISISKLNKYHFVANTEQLIFDGYLRIYDNTNKKSNSNKTNNDVKIGTTLQVQNLRCEEEYKRPPIRYNEASLVKKLEQLGIGRPSTYASNISIIQSRKYVEIKNTDGIRKNVEIIEWSKKNNEIITKTREINLGKDKNRLIPTQLGINVCDFLNKYFENIMDYKFTSNMENQFDKIAKGKKKVV